MPKISLVWWYVFELPAVWKALNRWMTEASWGKHLQPYVKNNLKQKGQKGSQVVGRLHIAKVLNSNPSTVKKKKRNILSDLP
jgi:hypothetical protein